MEKCAERPTIAEQGAAPDRLQLRLSLEPRFSLRFRRRVSLIVRHNLRSVIAMVTMLALAGCSDVVTTRFASVAEAKSQGAFQRGWLPPVLPDSATAIVERNDLDLNKGTGSFEYDLSERNKYLESLPRVGAVARVEQDADILTLTTNGSRWEIRLPRSCGQGKWRVWGS